MPETLQQESLPIILHLPAAVDMTKEVDAPAVPGYTCLAPSSALSGEWSSRRSDMHYSAIVENRDREGFTATVLGWPGFTAEGRTREEALERLRQSFRDRLPKVEVVPLEVEEPEGAHPWMRFAGMFENDTLFDQVLDDIQAYRRELDADGTE